MILSLFPKRMRQGSRPIRTSYTFAFQIQIGRKLFSSTDASCRPLPNFISNCFVDSATTKLYYFYSLVPSTFYQIVVNLISMSWHEALPGVKDVHDCQIILKKLPNHYMIWQIFPGAGCHYYLANLFNEFKIFHYRYVVPASTRKTRHCRFMWHIWHNKRYWRLIVEKIIGMAT